MAANARSRSSGRLLPGAGQLRGKHRGGVGGLDRGGMVAHRVGDGGERAVQAAGQLIVGVVERDRSLQPRTCLAVQPAHDPVHRQGVGDPADEVVVARLEAEVDGRANVVDVRLEDVHRALLRLAGVEDRQFPFGDGQVVVGVARRMSSRSPEASSRSTA